MSDTTTVRRPRRTKAEQRAETLTQIFDTAEYLFSKRGLYGVTLRDVADHIGIQPQLLHYYFKDKAHLFEEVYARRAQATIDCRMVAMVAYEASCGDKPTVEGALHAFLDPLFDLFYYGGEGWMNHAAFSARASNTTEGAKLMDKLFDPLVLKLIGILRRALPDYTDEDLFWGYHFVTGALMQSLANAGRIDHVSGGICRSSDFPEIKKRMAKFMAAGFLALKGE